MSELLKTSYKGVQIQEVWNIPKNATLFSTNLPAHSDPTVRAVNVLGIDVDHVKQEIDARLQEMGLTEYKQ